MAHPDEPVEVTMPLEEWQEIVETLRMEAGQPYLPTHRALWYRTVANRIADQLPNIRG